MAALLKLIYLIACFVVANGMPRHSYKNTVSQTQIDDSRIINTVSHSQFSTYTSYRNFADYNFGRMQDRLNSILANMFQNLKLNLPVILINPQNVFGPYLPPDFVATADNPNGGRTPKYFPTTTRLNRPTPPYTVTASDRPNDKANPSSKVTPAIAASTKPTVEMTPSLSSRRTEVTASETPPETTTVEDYDDDNTRPIILRDPSSFENEVSVPASRFAPKVEHGSVQEGT